MEIYLVKAETVKLAYRLGPVSQVFLATQSSITLT